MAKIKRILLECTHTYETNLNTGIQRVVRNIINESKEIGKELGVKCQPVILKRGRFLAVDKINFSAVDKIKNKLCLRAHITAFLKDVYLKFRPSLQSIHSFDKIERFLLPAPGRFGLTTIVKIVLDILFLPVELMAYLQERVIPQKGDLLLLLDCSWHLPIWPAVKRAKDNGTRVGTVIYDLFPITYSQFCIPGLVEYFRVWFDQAMNNADFFIAISQTTRDEVKRYVELNRLSNNRVGRFESFQLGSTIDNVVRNGKVRDELKKVFESSDKPNTYLTVGTIEPRKNHKYLVDAFDEVWKRCPDVRLCIVGHLGWFYNEFLRRIRSHPQYRKYLFMFNDLSDTELDYCYRHAKALVYPSHAEGFGLPLVEALYKQLPVLASDIPIFREVGKEFCAYFDLSQPASLAKMVMNIEKERQMPEVRKTEEYQLPDWRDSCRELLTKTVALYERVSV